jgi:hypothetical protein
MSVLIKKKLVDKHKCKTILNSKEYKDSDNPKKCKEITILFTLGKKEGIEYSAKLNIHLLPKTKEIVLGTSKYLLPYTILNKYFITFACPSNNWTLNKNYNLIHCICNKYFGSHIIRIITTPKDLIDKNKNYRITAHELCIIKYNYNYNFYKLISDEFNNIYFCSNKKIEGCSEVNIDKQGNMICENKNLKKIYL